MYPNLLGPLLTLSGVALAGLAWLMLRQPVSRRLALRQVARRKTEAALVVTGSVLGTAIIIGALVVGDTLNHSVRQDAYRTLGPIDERVMSPNPAIGKLVSDRLAALRNDSAVDGVLTAYLDQGAAVHAAPSGNYAEPRVIAWDVDFGDAAAFGAAGGPSGLSGPSPTTGTVYLNQPLATSLHAAIGDSVTLFLYGQPTSLRVTRIVDERGLGGAGVGSTVNRNAYVPPGTLDFIARLHHHPLRAITFVSNRGGVESGDAQTSLVVARIKSELGWLANEVTIETPKHSLLAAAKTTGDVLGALFLMIGSFSIIAGALLLVNIFVMLAEERKSQLGMLRALGMKRSRLVGSLTLEGGTYALVSLVPGVLVGLAVGYGVALVAAQVFSTWTPDGSGLSISFAVTPTSLVNGAALGLVIAITTILLTSIRISRFNVINAIRDLPATSNPRARRWLLVTGTTLAVLTGMLAVPSVARSAAVPTLLLPSLAMLFAVPALQRLFPRRHAVNIAAGAVLVWSMVAPLVRPHMYDNPSMAVWVVSGVLVAFSAVVLVSQNQHIVLWPIRRLLERPSQTGLAVRLAVAYPLARRFRTGATLVMYTLITLVLVLLVEISGIVNKGVDTNVANATAGYSLRLDLNPVGARTVLRDLQNGNYRQQIAQVTPLVSSVVNATDPGHRTTTPLRSLLVGVPSGSMTTMAFDRRLPALPSDAAVWQLMARDPKYVVIDASFGSTGGPPSRYFDPGDTFTVTNPFTGETSTKTIAAVMSNAMIFYATAGPGANALPIITSDRSVRALFGPVAQMSSALVRTPFGTNPDRLAPQLQATYLSSSLVATPVATNIRRMFASSSSFFKLMEGFLALGLLVGVTGLGVVMVRAVRERRRTIGVLRALGFRASTVSRSFLIESGLVAAEGILLGAVLGVLTTWLMYQKSASFEGVRAGFPIVWSVIVLLAVATFVASLLATIGPARRAAQVRPALAVRVAE
jgi:putative ABC transport system permease protein